jgi:hypothetical protein
MPGPAAVTHALQSNTLADLLERVLDKGLVIAGDIRIKLVDVELLTLQIRLVICSVDRAREMGIDWWTANPAFQGRSRMEMPPASLSFLEERLSRLEAALKK